MSYAILVETSHEWRETWYNFISYNNNKENLHHLSKQLKSIDWKLIPHLATFQLHLDPLVSSETASEMCQLTINQFLPHQKFDGKMKKIYFDINEDNDGDVTKMGKVYDTLKYGRISKFFSGSGEEDKEEEEEDDDYYKTTTTTINDDHHTDYDSITSSDSEDLMTTELIERLKKSLNP